MYFFMESKSNCKKNVLYDDQTESIHWRAISVDDDNDEDVSFYFFFDLEKKSPSIHRLKSKQKRRILIPKWERIQDL